MNHNRDANVPIYLVPTLLRLTFSRREGNERPAFHATLVSLAQASIYTSIRVLHQAIRVCLNVRVCVCTRKKKIDIGRAREHL